MMIKNIVQVCMTIMFQISFCYSAMHNPFSLASDNKMFKVSPHDVAKLVTDATKIVQNIAESKQDAFDRAIKAQENARQDLAKRRDKGLIGNAEFEAESKTIDGRIKRLEDELVQFNRQSGKVDDNVQDVLMTGWKTALEVHKEEQQRKTQVALAGVTKAVENEGALERLKYSTSFLTQPTILLRTGAFLSLTGASLIAGYYALTYFYKKLGMPTLVKESSIKGWKESFLSFLFSTEEKDLSHFDDVIFNEKLDVQMRALAASTKQSKEKGLPYRHAMFYGPAGTGKTTFARKLAGYLDMDYVIIPGGNFGQFKSDQQIIELNRLFAWAKNSPRGMLIIIDEVEAFLRNRKDLTNDEIKVMSTFLEETGKSSEDYQIVVMTNLYEKLDPAVRSRFAKKVYFPLPEVSERNKIIKLYFKKYIQHDRRMVGRGDNRREAQIRVAQTITPEVLEGCAAQMNNWSGREIEQFCDELRARGYQADHFLLTKEIFDSVLAEKMGQHHAEEKLVETAAAA